MCFSAFFFLCYKVTKIDESNTNNVFCCRSTTSSGETCKVNVIRRFNLPPSKCLDIRKLYVKWTWLLGMGLPTTYLAATRPVLIQHFVVDSVLGCMWTKSAIVVASKRMVRWSTSTQKQTSWLLYHKYVVLSVTRQQICTCLGKRLIRSVVHPWK